MIVILHYLFFEHKAETGRQRADRINLTGPGKASKMTEYFAAPFPAAEWRSSWVEQIESKT